MQADGNYGSLNSLNSLGISINSNRWYGGPEAAAARLPGITQSIIQSVSQPVSQSVSQSISQSVS